MLTSGAGLGVHSTGGLCGNDPVSNTSNVLQYYINFVQFSGSECWCCVRLFCILPASG